VPEELCRHIALEIACGLEAIHAEDVVHRDLKPENVLVSADHVVKLMDLGVARVNEEGRKLSRTGTFVGSVLYAAPEQFGKPSEEIDGRSDLYALGLRLLLIGAARPEGMEEWTDRTLRSSHAVRLPLPRLGPRDLDRLLVEALRSETLADDLGWEIARKSDGNPLFVFEIVAELRDAGVIREQADGTWVRTGADVTVGLPSSLMDLVQSRLADLEPEDKDLLDVASCCGASFDPLLVAEALGMPEIPALKRLARIEGKLRLVHAQGRRYDFDHSLVHEALYERLSPLLREHYHGLLATALLNRLGGERPGGKTGVAICRHAIRGGLPDAAREHLGAALDHLETSHRAEAALELADAALAMKGVLEGTARIQGLLRKAERLEVLGRHEDEAAALTEALRLGEAIEDPRLGARIRRRLGRNALSVGRPEDARVRLREALDLAATVDDVREQAACLGQLGVIAATLDRTSEALELFGRAIEINRQTGWSTPSRSPARWTTCAARRRLGDGRAVSVPTWGTPGGPARACGPWPNSPRRHRPSSPPARNRCSGGGSPSWWDPVPRRSSSTGRPSRRGAGPGHPWVRPGLISRWAGSCSGRIVGRRRSSTWTGRARWERRREPRRSSSRLR